MERSPHTPAERQRTEEAAEPATSVAQGNGITRCHPADLFYESYNENLGLNGVGRVSSPGVDSRTGCAGYQWDQTISASHVRYRVYLPDIGRWTRRDPLGYVDSSNLYELVATRPVAGLDPMGLDKILCIVSNTKRANGDSFSSGHGGRGIRAPFTKTLGDRGGRSGYTPA